MNESRKVGVRTGLCDGGSEANNLALEELAEALKDIGFIVRKKPRREYTLRVYIRKNQYPLLNPRFRETAVEVNPQWDKECLEVTVVSKGKDASLDPLLSSFQNTVSCEFVPSSGVAQGYRYHGHFFMPLSFSSVNLAWNKSLLLSFRHLSSQYTNSFGGTHDWLAEFDQLG